MDAPAPERSLSAEELGMPIFAGAAHAGTTWTDGPAGPEVEQRYTTDADFPAVVEAYDAALPAGPWQHRKAMSPARQEAEYSREMGGMLHRALIRSVDGPVEIRLAIVAPPEPEPESERTPERVPEQG